MMTLLKENQRGNYGNKNKKMLHIMTNYSFLLRILQGSDVNQIFMFISFELFEQSRLISPMKKEAVLFFEKDFAYLKNKEPNAIPSALTSSGLCETKNW